MVGVESNFSFHFSPKPLLFWLRPKQFEANNSDGIEIDNLINLITIMLWFSFPPHIISRYFVYYQLMSVTYRVAVTYA